MFCKKMKHTLATTYVMFVLLVQGYIGLGSAVDSDLGDANKDVKDDRISNPENDKRRMIDYCEPVCRELWRQRSSDNSTSRRMTYPDNSTSSKVSSGRGATTGEGQTDAGRRRKGCDNDYENGFQEGLRLGFRNAIRWLVSEQPVDAYDKSSGTRIRNGETFSNAPGTGRGLVATSEGSGKRYGEDVVIGQGVGYGSGAGVGYGRGYFIPPSGFSKNDGFGNGRGVDAVRGSGNPVIRQSSTGTAHTRGVPGYDVANRGYSNGNGRGVDAVRGSGSPVIRQSSTGTAHTRGVPAYDVANGGYSNRNVNNDNRYVPNAEGNRPRVIVSEESGFKTGKGVVLGVASFGDASGGASAHGISARDGTITGRGKAVVYAGGTGVVSVTRDSASDRESADKRGSTEKIDGRGTSFGGEPVSGYDKSTTDRKDTHATSDNTRITNQGYGDGERRVHETSNTNNPRNGEEVRRINKDNDNKDSNSAIGYGTGVYMREGTFIGHGKGIGIVEANRNANGFRGTGAAGYGYGSGSVSGEGAVLGSGYSERSKDGETVHARGTGLSLKNGNFSGRAVGIATLT